MPSRARRHQVATSLIYHLFNRSINRAPIFRTEEDCRHFVRLLATYKSRFFIKIYHWAIMLTHFHLLLEMEDPREISRFMAGLNRAYTHYHHRVYGTSGFVTACVKVPDFAGLKMHPNLARGLPHLCLQPRSVRPHVDITVTLGIGYLSYDLNRFEQTRRRRRKGNFQTG